MKNGRPSTWTSGYEFTNWISKWDVGGEAAAAETAASRTTSKHRNRLTSFNVAGAPFFHHKGTVSAKGGQPGGRAVAAKGGQPGGRAVAAEGGQPGGRAVAAPA